MDKQGSMEKRYQECNKIEKLWRRRHYLYVPFKWLRTVLTNKELGLSKKNLWKLYIGAAQCDMNWTYTLEEVKDKLKDKSSK